MSFFSDQFHVSFAGNPIIFSPATLLWHLAPFGMNLPHPKEDCFAIGWSSIHSKRELIIYIYRPLYTIIYISISICILYIYIYIYVYVYYNIYILYVYNYMYISYIRLPVLERMTINHRNLPRNLTVARGCDGSGQRSWKSYGGTLALQKGPLYFKIISGKP